MSRRTVSPGELAFRLSRVSRKVGSGGLLLFRNRSPCPGRARVVVLLLGVGRPFARLVVGFVRVGLVFGTCFQKIRKLGVSQEFSFSFPVSGINSLDKFSESNEGVQLFMVDHIVFDSLASPL